MSEGDRKYFILAADKLLLFLLATDLHFHHALSGFGQKVMRQLKMNTYFW